MSPLVATRSWLSTRPRVAYAAALVALAASYVVAARIGLLLAIPPGVASPVWPPVGIALAVLVLFGLRLWPGVFLGALVANALLTEATPVAVVAIAVGNTLEAMVAAVLLQRVAHFQGLDRVRDVIALAAFAALFSTAVSATIGVTALVATEAVAIAAFWDQWRVWWLGDALGDLLVAPVLLAWLRPGNWGPRTARAVEAVLLAVAIAAVTWVSFVSGELAYSYALFPLLMWVALRFRQRGITLAGLLVSAVAMSATLNVTAPFDPAAIANRLLVLQAMAGIVAVTGLVITAALGERERAEERQHLLVRDLVELDAQRSQFLAVVTHDLNSPLAAIRGLTETLQTDWDDLGPVGARAIVDRVHANSLRLLGLASQVGEFSRLEAGQVGPKPTPFDLGELARRTADEVTAATGRAIVVTSDAAVAQAYADESHAWQILGNLLTNAVKYSPADAIVRVEVGSASEVLTVRVSDRGAGIPSEEVERIFDRFYRGRPQTEPGVGLGLFIARTLVEANGGRIWVDATAPEGSTFAFTLPTARS